MLSYLKINIVLKINTCLAILLFLGCLSTVLHGQQRRQTPTPARQSSKANLQEQAKKLETQIRDNSKLLDEVSKNRTTNVDQVNILNAQIIQRDQLIRTINAEISIVNSEVRDFENQITALEREIKNLKNEYAKLVVATQRHLNPSEQLMFIVASESFNQAYRRLKYFQQYSAHRKKQVELIHQKQEELTDLKTALEQEKETKTQLLSKEQQEKKDLDSEKAQRDRAVVDLRKKENQLRDQIRKDQAEVRRVNQQIEKIIAQEVEAARQAAAKRAADEAAKRGTTPSKPAAPDVTQLTPEEKKLADNFVGNRGKLPWPTERGAITVRFGVHDHPVVKGIKTENGGIDISTRKDEVVRAVFEGIVVTEMPTPSGNGRMIIIVHGNYRTVYVNLKSVSVKVGEKVTSKQTIGAVNTHNDKTVLNFQIWRDLQKLDPEQWIAKLN
jgi:septal ring factor EnvC (AmiA/AmiB activator)